MFGLISLKEQQTTAITFLIKLNGKDSLSSLIIHAHSNTNKTNSLAATASPCCNNNNIKLKVIFSQPEPHFRSSNQSCVYKYIYIYTVYI